MSSPSTDLVALTPSELGSIGSVRDAIDRIDDLAVARDYANRATAAASYFQMARETKHLADRATEVRIWAERRAGELLIEQGQDPDGLTAISRELGTSTQTVRRWVRLAKAEERRVETTISEIRRTDGEITVTGVSRRLLTKQLKRVERGIYVNYLGNHVLRWRDRGVTRQIALEGQDLTQARRHLLVQRGQLPEKEKATRGLGQQQSSYAVIADSYNEIRQVLQRLDGVRASLDPGVRRLVDKAHVSLYEAEDLLGKALREQS